MANKSKGLLQNQNVCNFLMEAVPIEVVLTIVLLGGAGVSMEVARRPPSTLMLPWNRISSTMRICILCIMLPFFTTGALKIVYNLSGRP